MQYGYIVKISKKNIYREVQLPIDAEYLKVGLGIDCDVRFFKEDFFEDFEMTFRKVNEEWQIECSEGIYIDSGDVQKLMTKKLRHGDSFSIKYQNSESEVFKVDFLFDFDNENKDYDRCINVSGVSNFYIGSGSGCEILINSDYVKNDLIQLQKTNQGDLTLNIKQTMYGVYHNGKLATNGEMIKNGDFFSIANFSFYYKNGELRTSKDVAVSNLNYIDITDKGTYPRFIKNARIHSKINDKNIDILEPAPKREKGKNNLLMSLLPSMGMLLASGAMVMMSGGNGGMLIFSGMSAGMAIITAIMSFVENKKEFKESKIKRKEQYTKYIENKRAEIEKKRADEKEQREVIYVDISEEEDRFDCFSSKLFDRKSEDEDFLAVRLGSGSIKAAREINYKKQEKLEPDDELQSIPEKIKNEYKYIEGAPIICDFRHASAVCINGPENLRFEIFKNIIFDICARHFYSDVEMIFVAEEQHKSKIDWLRMLPYVNNEENQLRNVVCDDESKNRIFDYLYKELTTRAREERKEVEFKHIVVFMYDDYGIKKHPLSKFIEKGRDLNITFVFMTNQKSEAPIGCSYIIEVESDKKGTLIDTYDNEKNLDFTFTPISDSTVKNVVDFMAPVSTEEISLEGSLTKNISWFDMMGIFMVDDINLEDRWQSSQVYKSMAAPIGVTKSEYVYLDLHDKAHGPHGLVAGTTGAGKSEILQTYILSIATLFHPYEVSFVIIDFKGGGMVNQFKDLPHLLGAITNIDGKEIDRSLKSIKAELQKRQRLFAEVDVNHIDKYIQKFRDGEAKVPIPHLVLIVDEFAELKAEQPDFMKELISTARIGRSLGVHLILATQKPSGQVDEQIWSNSRFKLCLKVQSVEDSNEVLKSPLAAEIKEPGRAYLQVGNNEIFELFQSAYSGAPEKITDSNKKEFSILQLSTSGKRKEVFSQKKNEDDEEEELNTVTQLDAVVNYVHEYCEKEHIIRLPNICLPSLPSVIPHAEATFDEYGQIDIGIYDDPDNQVQTSTFVDFKNKNTIVIGSSQYGKTNLLQLLIKSISSCYSPDQAIFYILDFGSMVLKNYEKLNHVGGVVTSSEDEKLKNLFKLLLEEINERKERMLEVGVSSFSSYLEAGYTDLPHIYLMVDNFTALSEMYLEDDDSLLMIIRDGISVGISTIIANPQTSGISYKYISNFANKIMFYCNDTSEYSNIFDYVDVKPDEKPGRCVLELGKRMLECQTYHVFDGEKEIDRVNAIRSFIEDTNTRFKDSRARQIPCIPNVLTEEMMTDAFGVAFDDYRLPIGLTYDEVKPFYLDLKQMGVLGICGKEGTGHKNFVTHLINSLNSNERVNANIVLFDDVSRKFEDYKDKVNKYSVSATDAIDVIKEWHQELQNRYERLLLEEENEKDDELLLMIVQNNDVASAIQSDIETSEMMEDILTRYKNFNVGFVLANYPNSNISYEAADLIRDVKQNQHLLYFEDLQNLKCFDPPYEAVRDNKKPLSLGDAYYIIDNDVTKLKIVLSEEKEV